MKVPPKIGYAAQRLKEGRRVNRVTVRDFLRHFGAERRGAAKVAEIRKILDSLNLRTEPDFESAWIGEPIWLRLKDGVAPPVPADDLTDDRADADGDVLNSTPSAVEQAVEQSEAAPTSVAPEAPEANRTAEISDPTFRIGSLPAANKPLITVNQNDNVSRAVTLMLQHDFSQLPVMQGEREVKGVVTWKSIGSRLALATKCQHVADCSEGVQIVDANRTLFDTIPVIVEHGYVLVRQKDRRITGIVTASDLSLQFRLLTEPFLLLREIELHVRLLLQKNITRDDFHLAENPAPADRQPQSISDLTFGQYVRLVQNPQVWEKLNLNVDSKILTKLLDEIREIRNEVMHFHPDPMTEQELDILKMGVRFLQELYELVR